AYGPQNDVTLKMPAFEWVHVQLHQQKGMISLSPPTICNSALPRDLTPKPTSRRNEPAHLPHILERIAHWRGENPQWLSATIDANVRTLFEVTF
ncbi:TatD family hydrolase, partial [Citrobacter freundii]|uniref:TatD family hydrolase n=1 Tax=Citrobacter freundii TaxID=546 RepID=UPI003B43106C